MRIVHHRGSPLGAGREVVRQAERVADLVLTELAQTREGEALDRLGVDRLAVFCFADSARAMRRS